MGKREIYVFLPLTLWLTAQHRPFLFQKCPFQIADPIAHSSVWEIQYSGLCFAPRIDPHSTRSLLSNLFPPPYWSCAAHSVFNEVSTLKQFRWREKIPNVKLSSTTGNEGWCWSGVTDENQGLGPCSEEFACSTLACVSLCVRVFVWILSSYSGFLAQRKK